MILVDTSVWIDHLRSGDPELESLLNREQVLAHPFVIGELALGNLGQREIILKAMQDLPPAIVASHEEAMALIAGEKLSGLGIGYVDAHLLAAARLTRGAQIWTRDKRLREIAEELSVGCGLA